MKKFLSMIAVIILLLNMFSRFEATAYEKQDFYNVQIPIFQGNTEEISTELLNGITSDDKSKEGIIYISLEDFQRLSNAEVLRKSDDVVELKRNSVYLELRVNSEKAILSLAYAENAVEESFDIVVPSIKQKNNIYISLTHALNSFGIEMNIMDKDSISNMISIYNKVLDEKYTDKTTLYFQDSGIFDFNTYPKYLYISSSEPFDKYFLEYYFSKSDYLFSWNSLFLLNDITSSLGSIPSNYIFNYEGMTDYIIGEYEADERYYDILCTIINNECSYRNNLDISKMYNTINKFVDSGAIEKIMENNQTESSILSFVISSTSDAMNAAEKTTKLLQCAEYQDNVLEKTILSSNELKKQMIDDKFVTDVINNTIFNKYNNNTYLSSLYNNQYALYKSADKLNKDIDNPIKNISFESYWDLVYKGLTTVGDFALGTVSGGATEIPDLLMKNIKYNDIINNTILSPSESLGQVKDCYFIQNVTKDMCNANLFDEPESAYYKIRLTLQSATTAYELISNNKTLLNLIGTKGQELSTKRNENIKSILSDIEKSDISFYSVDGISDELKGIKDFFIMIEDNTEDIVDSGICGDDLTWRLNTGGKLTISGTGGMYDYADIGSPFYKYKQDIKDVIISDDVTYIGENAFAYCEKLETIDLPDDLTIISYGCFTGCKSLKDISIPESVTKLDLASFEKCEQLSKIVLPNDLKEIGWYAFSGCTNLTDIVIPESVEVIGNGAFCECSKLKSIIIPNHVESISSDTFARCTSLTSITIAKDVEVNGKNIFYETPNVVIYGYSGTSAEKYAKNNNISFVELNSNNSTDETINWQQLYADELINYMNTDDYIGHTNNSTFDIFDINNDGIPELFILSGNQCTICSIFNGELIRTDKKYMEYGMCSLSKKVFSTFTMKNGHSITSYYQLDNGSLTCMVIASDDIEAMGVENATYKINDV